MTSYLMKQ